MTQGRLTALLVGILAVLVAGGATAAYSIGKSVRAGAGTDPSPGTSTPAPSVQTVFTTRRTVVTRSPSPSPGTSPNPSGSRPTASTGTEGNSQTPSSSTLPSSEGSWSASSTPTSDAIPTTDATVRVVGNAQGSADADEVRELVQRNFDAINAHDFAAWKATVTAQQGNDAKQDRWEEDYSTTRNRNVRIVGIAADLSSVDLTFTSYQAKEKSYQQRSTCTLWDITLPIVRENGELRLGPRTGALKEPVTCG